MVRDSSSAGAGGASGGMMGRKVKASLDYKFKRNVNDFQGNYHLSKVKSAFPIPGTTLKVREWREACYYD
jgi:hypothetical protein